MDISVHMSSTVLAMVLLGSSLVGAAASEASHHGSEGDGSEGKSFRVDHTGGAVFLCTAIFLGIFFRTAGRGIGLPYTVVLLVRADALCSHQGHAPHSCVPGHSYRS